jgi:hypothetical protein
MDLRNYVETQFGGASGAVVTLLGSVSRSTSGNRLDLSGQAIPTCRLVVFTLNREQAKTCEVSFGGTPLNQSVTKILSGANGDSRLHMHEMYFEGATDDIVAIFSDNVTSACMVACTVEGDYAVMDDIEANYASTIVRVNGGNSASPSVTYNQHPQYADTVQFIAVGVEGPDNDTTGTWPAPYTRLARIGHHVLGGTDDRVLDVAYKKVSGIIHPSYETGTLTLQTSRKWAALGAISYTYLPFTSVTADLHDSSSGAYGGTLLDHGQNISFPNLWNRMSQAERDALWEKFRFELATLVLGR